MKKLSLTVVPLDLYAGPIGSDDRALIRRAVMPSHAVADSQSFGLVGCHDGILPRESRSVPPRRTRTDLFWVLYRTDLRAETPVTTDFTISP
jgi:hypothetical protein